MDEEFGRAKHVPLCAEALVICGMMRVTEGDEMLVWLLAEVSIDHVVQVDMLEASTRGALSGVALVVGVFDALPQRGVYVVLI